MKINNQDINIDDLVSDKYMHKELDNGLFLSDYQIGIIHYLILYAYICH